MDNIKQSELIALKSKLIKGIKNWKPSGGDAPDCFTMLYDYDEAVKKLKLHAVGITFLDKLRLQIEYHQEQEQTFAKVKDYKAAMYHEHHTLCLQTLITWIEEKN